MLLSGASSGSIFGTITDASGAVVPGVRIVVKNTAQGVETKTTSNSKGAYRLSALPVGRYDLTAEAPGFKPQSRRGLGLHVDDVMKVDLVLESTEKAESISGVGSQLAIAAK